MQDITNTADQVKQKTGHSKVPTYPSREVYMYRIYDTVVCRYLAGWKYPIPSYMDNGSGVFMVYGQCVAFLKSKKLDGIRHRLVIHKFPCFEGGNFQVINPNELLP